MQVRSSILRGGTNSFVNPKRIKLIFIIQRKEFILGAPKKNSDQKVHPLAATHDWVLVMNEKGKKSFQWVPKNNG